MQYHVFISYARADNQPRGPDGRSRVDIFNDELKARHRRLTGHDLKTFFDTSDLKNGEDWEARIQPESRRSRIFIAILSPNYLDSGYCRLALEDYIRHEQSIAPGDAERSPALYREAVETMRQLVEDTPGSATEKRDLAISLFGLARANLAAGNNGEAVPLLLEAKTLLEKIEAERCDLDPKMRGLLDLLRKSLNRPGLNPRTSKRGTAIPARISP